jgi:hypothetical protein
MNNDLQKRALATREAHLALLDLKKVVDQAIQTTHAAELEAVHLALKPSLTDNISTMLQVAMESLGSPNFEDILSKARQRLQTAMS